MRTSAIGATSSGSLALFWPEQLPADFDQRWVEEPNGLISQLEGEGKLLLIDVAAGGDYALAIFVEEAVPAELEPYCTLVTKHEKIDVSGPTWFGDIELLTRDMATLAKPKQLRRPKCSELAIPLGMYSAELFSAEYPSHVYEDWLSGLAGESEQRWWWVQTWFASLGIVMMMVFVGCLFFGTRPSVYISLGVSTVLLFIAWLMSRTSGYKKIQQARLSYAAAHPDFVIRLRKQGSPIHS